MTKSKNKNNQTNKQKKNNKKTQNIKIHTMVR